MGCCTSRLRPHRVRQSPSFCSIEFDLQIVMETAAAANVGLKAPSTLLCTPTLASPDPTGCRKRWGRGPSRTRSKEGLTYTELGLRTRPRRFSLARMEGRSEVRNPTKEKERDKKTQSLRGVRELS